MSLGGLSPCSPFIRAATERMHASGKHEPSPGPLVGARNGEPPGTTVSQ